MRYPEGVIPPVLTPFRQDVSVDIASAERHMDYLVKRGVGGLFVLGTNGEGYDTDTQARRAMVQAAQNACGGQVPVYAGCMGMGTADMIAAVTDAPTLRTARVSRFMPTRLGKI